MKNYLLALCGLSFFIVSCNKKDTVQNVTPTVQNLTGTYLVARLTVTASGGSEQDVTNTVLEPCEKDDLWKLNADMSFDYVDAGTQCSPAGSYTDTWSLTNSSTIVINNETYNIKSFNGTALAISQTNNGSVYTAYYNKQ